MNVFCVPQHAGVIIYLRKKIQNSWTCCDHFSAPCNTSIIMLVDHISLEIVINAKLILFNKYLFEQGQTVLLIKKEHGFFIVQ